MAAFGQGREASVYPSDPADKVPATSAISSADLFRDYGVFVWRLLRRFGVHDAELDDLTQEVFIAVHRSLGNYEEQRQIKAWLYRITARIASRHRRRQPPPSLDIEELANIEASEDSPERAIHASQARANFDRLLSVLDDDRRTVFVLFELEELPMYEIAEAIGCPLQTAYSRLRAARKMILEAAHRLEARHGEGSLR